jgi:uncharacterized membrane protein
MSWHDRHRLKEFIHSSFWLFPSLSLGLAWLVAKLILWLVPTPEWPRFDDSDVEGMRVSMAAFASSMLTFVVYAVSALLLAVQLASGQITPRLIRITFSRWQMKFATSLFVFAFGVTMVALSNMTEQLRHPLVIVLAIAGNVASVLVFFWFVEQVGLGLRPVAVLQDIFADGKEAMDGVYAHDFDAAVPEGTVTDELAGREGRIARRIGPSGTFLAFGSRDLVALARRAGCTIELIPQVGDFVSTGDPLARIYPPDRPAGHQCHGRVRVGTHDAPGSHVRLPHHGRRGLPRVVACGERPDHRRARHRPDPPPVTLCRIEESRQRSFAR